MALLFLLALICLNAAYATDNSTIETAADLEETSHDFNMIQSLVDDAEEDASIYLEDDTYISNGNSIRIDKNIHIYGKNTVLDGKKSSGIFHVSKDKKLSLNNLKIINSADTAIVNYGELTINNSTCDYNSGNYGGVVENRADLIVANSRFSNNQAIQGGVIFNFKKLSIENCEFNKNQATHTCGVIYSNTGEVNVTSSRFSRNDGKDQGGCIFLASGFLNIDSSVFTSNKAQSYGGAIDNSGGRAIIQNSLFEKNQAYGAGAIDNGGPTTIINSNFTSNRATVNGGAIDNNDMLNMTGCILENNTAGQKGGAIMARSQTLVTHSFIIGNTASDADAIYVDEESISIDNNWWGRDDPDFSKLVNYEIDDDFRWLVSDDDAGFKTINRKGEIQSLENPELLPQSRTTNEKSQADVDKDNVKTDSNKKDNDKESGNGKDNQESYNPNHKNSNSGLDKVLKSFNQAYPAKDNKNKKEDKDINKTMNEAVQKSIDNTWILLIVLLLILGYGAYRKFKN